MAAPLATARVGRATQARTAGRPLQHRVAAAWRLDECAVNISLRLKKAGVRDDDRLAGAAGFSGAAGEPDRGGGNDRDGTRRRLGAFPSHGGAWHAGVAFRAERAQPLNGG